MGRQNFWLILAILSFQVISLESFAVVEGEDADSCAVQTGISDKNFKAVQSGSTSRNSKNAPQKSQRSGRSRDTRSAE